MKQLSKDSSEVLYQLAYTHYKEGKFEQAEGLFRLLTVSQTRTRKYWMGLGASLQMLKKFENAIEAYELAAALDPMDPQVHIYASDCFIGLGKIKEGLFALDCAERAIQQQKQQDKNLLAHIALVREAWKEGKNA